MVNKSIFESLKNYSKNELEELNQKALDNALKCHEDILNEAESKKEALINEARLNKESRLEQKENEYLLKEKNSVNTIKREILNELSDNVQNSLKSHKESDLLNLVYTLIIKEEVTGSEIIKVSKDDYNLYRKALCSNKKEDLIETDLLNKLNDRFNFKLSNEAASITSGFILIGEYYDLNFDFKELVLTAVNSLEKELSHILFD